MFRFIIFVLCCLTFVILPSSGHAYVPFLTGEQLDTAKEKAQINLDAKKSLLIITRQADRAAAQSVKISNTYGGLAQDYVCPEHGMLLYYDEKAGVHRCPADNKQHSGEKLDAAQRYYAHMRNSRATKDLGLAYALTGDSRYAAAGRDILLQYAKNWTEYKNPNITTDHGHLFWQVLDEAQFATNIAWGYNLIYPALTVNEQQAIEKELLTPLYSLLQTQQAVDRSSSLSRVWSSAGSILLGFATNNQTWVNAALDGPLGLKQQIDKGVSATGLWAEGPLEYHTSALSAISSVAELAPLFGYDLTTSKNLRAMFAAPLTLTTPTGQPAKALSADLCELAYAWYRDPVFAKYLSSIYTNPATKVDRLSYRALFYGLPLTISSEPSLASPALPVPSTKTESLK